jgi:hypothetical protein
LLGALKQIDAGQGGSFGVLEVAQSDLAARFSPCQRHDLAKIADHTPITVARSIEVRGADRGKISETIFAGPHTPPVIRVAPVIELAKHAGQIEIEHFTVHPVITQRSGQSGKSGRRFAGQGGRRIDKQYAWRSGQNQGASAVICVQQQFGFPRK